MQLANYAVQPENSKGRLFKEESVDPKMLYLVDRSRIVHSQAFRRLEYKTQVFVNHLGDHFRTRLTHSLEVAQISRIIARVLEINEDLAEVMALSHDIGHPPFGHAGEDALNEAAKEYGGFDHNVQTLKIMTTLEHRFCDFDGLNLTWEVLEGTMKHNGPLVGHGSKYKKLPDLFSRLDRELNLDITNFSSLEAQVAGLADDIAYCNHDIDDGMRAHLFELEELFEMPIILDVFDGVKKRCVTSDETTLKTELIRALTKLMAKDLITNTSKNIESHNISSPEDVRSAKSQMACFSPEVEAMKKNLKAFLMERVYRHYKVNRMNRKAHQVLERLFKTFFENPNCLPTEWYQKVKGVENFAKADIIKDYISGMTDRYAISEYDKLFNPQNF